MVKLIGIPLNRHGGRIRRLLAQRSLKASPVTLHPLSFYLAPTLRDGKSGVAQGNVSCNFFPGTSTGSHRATARNLISRQITISSVGPTAYPPS